MPITSIRLQNFKCFADSGEIPIRPLTVIFGRNNTGKSSIIQSLLLLRQTLDSPEYEPRLNLKGPLYAAGTYADIVHRHHSKQAIVMEIGLDAYDSPAEIRLEFRSDEPRPPQLFRIAVQGGDYHSLEIRRVRGAGGPYRLFIAGDEQDDDPDAGFRFGTQGFIPLIGDEPRKRGRPSDIRQETREFAREALSELATTLRAMRAVGAFRQQPDRRYEYQGRVSEGLAAAGEDAIAALIDESTGTRRKQRGLLLKSVNHWLKRVGRVSLMPLRRISKSARIFEVRLRDIDSGRWANFADVGFGIGQALPVLVEGLRTPLGGTFVVQEPEIHLHPDAQLAMADFLVSLVRTGRRVIVESHSEHLLLRFRHLLLGARSNGRAVSKLARQDLAVIFVESTQGGASQARLIHVDALGQFEDWPKGFMEEATDERMEILKAMAERAESHK